MPVKLSEDLTTLGLMIWAGFKSGLRIGVVSFPITIVSLHFGYGFALPNAIFRAALLGLAIPVSIGLFTLLGLMMFAAGGALMVWLDRGKKS